MQNYLLLLLTMFAVAFSPLGASAADPVSPANNPSNGSGATNFDWQAEWGTIHMNSFADGLTDPGAHSTKDGQAPCNGNLCKVLSGQAPIAPEISPAKVSPAINSPSSVLGSNLGYVGHGIKYDIKNSLLNCMSKQVPNWALLPGRTTTYAQNNVCTAGHKMQPLKADESAVQHGNLRTMIYLPIWDSRANDERAEDQGQPVGCQQQVTNTCGSARDIHDCRDPSNGQRYDAEPSYKFPVSHTFSPQEVADLGGTGAQLPAQYYHYEKITATELKTNELVAPAANSFIDLTTHDIDVYNWSTGTTITHIPEADCKTIADVQQLVSCTNKSGGKCDCKLKHWEVVSTQTKYNYKLITDSRSALSRVYPTDAVPGTAIDTIHNGPEQHLARIKTYMINNNDAAVSSSAILVDPSDFYDLRLYTPGGKYQAGYNKKDTNGYVATYDSCPVLGLKSGYSGICDPTGNAGCNLPIYAVGPSTTFTDVASNTFNYNDYPIVWSGYAKKWSVLTVEQYLENIVNRKSYGGSNLYLQGIYVNQNPVIMLTRAKEYCDNRELSSKPVKLDLENPPVADMECIQYLQYQAIDKKVPVPTYAFVDMYAPDEDPQLPDHVEFTQLRLYNIDKDGKPSTPVADASLSGSGEFVGQPDKKTGFLSFKDAANAKAVFIDESKNVTSAAVIKTEYDKPGDPIYDPVTKKRKSDFPVYGTENEKRPGEYLSIDAAGVPDTTKGAGIISEPGVAMIVGMKENITVYDKNGENPEQVPCAVISTPANDVASQVFIPTNTKEEFNAFLKAASKVDKDGINAVPGIQSMRKCSTSFGIASDPASVNPSDAAAPKTSTWSGKLSCNGLSARPACNQTKLISAQRFCFLENGSRDVCESCIDAVDPDESIAVAHLTNDGVGGEILANPLVSKKNRCYFSAACFNNSATDCPMAGTSGGHVFCLSADTKITMGDGSEKEIKQIKAGEMVMGFDAKFSRSGALHPVRVKATAITRKQEILNIDGLKITPRHKMVLANGRAVMAQELKVGDQILKADGKVMTISSIKNDSPPITVYNLVLEKGADGYIANGLRVLSYPNMKGLGKSKATIASK